MKRVFAIILILVLLTPALAESVPVDTPLTIDLDGDGSQETLSWAMIPDEWEQHLQLSVSMQDGSTAAYDAEIYSNEAVYVNDLDGDGVQEIFLTGDVMSDDYYTWCLHLVNGSLYEVLFPDTTRSDEATKAYYKSGYGLITDISGNSVKLMGSQDMLGTFMATRIVTLAPWGLFEFSDDGKWHRAADLNDIDLWTYAALTTTREIPYNDEEAVLPAGTRLIITAMDKKDTAWFVTEDGVEGRLSVSKDYNRGFGSMVSNMPEEECFEYLPYAD